MQRPEMASPDLELRAAGDEVGWRYARRIREQVFCGEQACPVDEEFDDHDLTSRQLLGWVAGEAVATARWRVVRRDGEEWAKLERFAVLPEWRGKGLGRRWIAAVIEDARAHGHQRLLLHAQAHLVSLYAALGFVVIGERFVEAGIEHLEMRRREKPAPATDRHPR